MFHPIIRDRATGLGDDNPRSLTSWSVVGALLLGICVLALVFFREIVSAIDVWNTSTAYSHCYLVLPMALYLLWERRSLWAGELAEPELRYVWLAVPLTSFWLVAERLGIMEARQLAVVCGFELLFLSVLGQRLYRLVAGPLLFLFFLVPFGAFLTPFLQQFTAMFSVTGLNLLGIANYSDQFTIETPAGIFFVAEACAGLRFLIAAIAFGVFYSLLIYGSYKRRAAFIGASIVVPVFANGFRALGIVVLGQVLGSAQAAAADHLVYGWIFFSAVMLILIVVGQMFRDAGPVLVATNILPFRGSTRSPLWCSLGATVLLGLGPGVASLIDSNALPPNLPQIATIVAPPGCTSTAGGEGRSSNPSVSSVTCDQIRFDITVTSFAARSTSSAIITERRRVTREIGAENASVSTVRMSEGSGYWTVVQTTDPDRVTAYATWVDGLQPVSTMAGRIAQAYDSIFGATYAPALITVTVDEPPNSLPSKRREAFESLSRLLVAQSGLDARMALLTKLGHS